MKNRYALEEFLENCRSRDLIKAKLVLDHLEQIDEQEQRRVLFEVNRCPDDFGLPLLVHLATGHTELFDRYPALHETLLDKASNNPVTIVEKIGNDHPERRFYIDLAGELRLSQAVSRLLESIKNTSDIAVIRSILRSLGSIGDPSSAGTIGDFLRSEHKTLVETAVQALEKIATDEAMRLLAERLGEDDEKDTSILDVFANVGSGFCLQRLKETLKSANARIRNYGKSKLTALGKAAVPVMIPNLFSNDSDLQIHSLNILQEIGDESAVMSVRQLLDNQPEDANVRFAAYETLANLPTRKIEYVLAAGLTDPDDGIRLAAARAVENSFNTVLLAGINNMIKKRDAEAIRIIKAVIDAQTDRLFIRLLDNDFFRNLMFDYVAIRIHPDIRRYYIELLKKNDLAQLANDIVSHSKTVELHEARPKICAVDDSRMILHIYRSILNDLGYDPVLFQYPRDFLNWLTEEKPKAVFTDLNMPEITGLELVDKVRARYDKNEVPVVMATTQKDKQDRTEAERKGVNVFLFKPFDINTIENVLNNLWS